MFILKNGALSELLNHKDKITGEEIFEFFSENEWQKIFVYNDFKEEWFVKVSKYKWKQSFIIPIDCIEEFEEVEVNEFFIIDFLKKVNPKILFAGVTVSWIAVLSTFWYFIPDFTQAEEMRSNQEKMQEINNAIFEIEKSNDLEALYIYELKEKIKNLNNEILKSEMKVEMNYKKIETFRKQKFLLE